MEVRQDGIVFIVDDDRRVREAVAMLLSSVGLKALAFDSATAYIDSAKPDVPACLVLDVQLPDLSGLDLQARLLEDDHPHIVFISAHGDVPSTVRAIKAGAVDFLIKPFRDEDLLRAVEAALAANRDARRRNAALALLRRRLAQLTPRERDVLPLVVAGLLNKQAAAELGISEVTLQIHRGSIMRKMQAASLPELVRMAGMLGIPVTRSRRPSR